MKRKNQKKLMWLPFFIGMFYGNPFTREVISFFGDDFEKEDSLDKLLCILYHTVSIFFIGFVILFILI